MSGQLKPLCALLLFTAMGLAFVGYLFNDYLHARRFVRYGIEQQGTIRELDHVVGGRSREYVYSLRIGQTSMLKRFPYNWTPPINRSFLVLSGTPGPDDVALGNQSSGTLTVLCYMEGCDMPGQLLLLALVILVCAGILPFMWIRFFRTGELPQLGSNA